MRTPIFLNESRTPEQLGDLRIFDSLASLCAYVEPIDVENGEYVAFDAEGRLLSLASDGNGISVQESEARPMHAAILARLLREALVTMGYPDGRPAATAGWCEAASLDQLVARSLDVERAWRLHGQSNIATRLVETARRWFAPS